MENFPRSCRRPAFPLSITNNRGETENRSLVVFASPVPLRKICNSPMLSFPLPSLTQRITRTLSAPDECVQPA
jgi:hypothetical protein